MANHHSGRRGDTRSAWKRPPLGQRLDQSRHWAEIALADLVHPALPELNAAWERAAAAERLVPPSRVTFQPTSVVAALGRITVLERATLEATPGGAGEGGAGTWRYRLVGTAVVDLVQEDFTGRTIEHFHPALADMLRAQLGRAAEAGRPVAFTVRAVVDHRPYAYERIVLPVRSAPDVETDQMVLVSMPLAGG